MGAPAAAPPALGAADAQRYRVAGGSRRCQYLPPRPHWAASSVHGRFRGRTPHPAARGAPLPLPEGHAVRNSVHSGQHVPPQLSPREPPARGLGAPSRRVEMPRSGPCLPPGPRCARDPSLPRTCRGSCAPGPRRICFSKSRHPGLTLACGNPTPQKRPLAFGRILFT